MHDIKYSDTNKNHIVRFRRVLKNLFKFSPGTFQRVWQPYFEISKEKTKKEIHQLDVTNISPHLFRFICAYFILFIFY